MKKSSIISKVYEKCLAFLLLPCFNWLCLVLSHGFFHLILLFVVGFTALYFYKENQDKLEDATVHTIFVNVEGESLESYKRSGVLTESVDMSDIQVAVKLNSDSISKQTDGKYRDAVSVTFTAPQEMRDGHPVTLCKDIVNIEILRTPHQSGVEVEAHDSKFIDGNENLPPIEILQDSAGIIKMTSVLANIAESPMGDCFKGRSLTVYGDDFGIGESPYYYYNIRCNFPDSLNNDYCNCYLSIDLDDSYLWAKNFGSYSEKQLIIREIRPEPDLINGFNILYFTKKSIREITNNGGVHLYAEDIARMNKNSQEEFLNSVLVGTCLAFMLDIIIHLILKLRRLHQTMNKRQQI